MKKIVIAIDGYSACGKSSTAKEVASQLGYTYIDSGAMYRAVTLYFHNNYVAIDNPKQVQKAIEDIHISFNFNEKLAASETYLNGLNVEEEIRKMYISNQVSKVSALVEVRRYLVSKQRQLGKKKGVVMDGRDIGSNVFPDAELKIFMTADLAVRAGRRQQELLLKKQLVSIPDIEKNLVERDKMDSEREENPLIIPEDAYLIDTSELTLAEQVDNVLQLAIEKIIEHDG